MDYPLNDESMYWDMNMRFYVLTKDEAEDYLGEDISIYFDGNDRRYEAFLEEISEDIMEYIYSNTMNTSIPTKRYVIAKDGTIRDDIKRVLLYQLRYAYRSSANLLKDMHGVHVEKGKALGLGNLRGEIGIASNAIRVLQNIGLLYRGNSYRKFDIEEDGSY